MNLQNLVIEDLQIDNYGSIVGIQFTNGYSCIPGEDTGGEYAILSVDCDLYPGDILSFNYELDEFDGIWGLHEINVNGTNVLATVGSEGGNSSTYLTFIKPKK